MLNKQEWKSSVQVREACPWFVLPGRASKYCIALCVVCLSYFYSIWEPFIMYHWLEHNLFMNIYIQGITFVWQTQFIRLNMASMIQYRTDEKERSYIDRARTILNFDFWWKYNSKFPGKPTSLHFSKWRIFPTS